MSLSTSVLSEKFVDSIGGCDEAGREPQGLKPMFSKDAFAARLKPRPFKAHREATPDATRKQVPRLRKTVLRTITLRSG